MLVAWKLSKVEQYLLLFKLCYQWCTQTKYFKWIPARLSGPSPSPSPTHRSCLFLWPLRGAKWETFTGWWRWGTCPYEFFLDLLTPGCRTTICKPEGIKILPPYFSGCTVGTVYFTQINSVINVCDSYYNYVIINYVGFRRVSLHRSLCWQMVRKLQYILLWVYNVYHNIFLGYDVIVVIFSMVVF